MKARTLPGLVSEAGTRLGRSGQVVRLLRPLCSSVLRTAYGRRGIPWHVNGEALRIDPRVRHLMPHTGEEVLFEFLRSRIQPGDVVFDIGSFLGAYAVMAARWSGETGRVLAFEPSPDSFATLCRHLRMNHLAAPRVEVRPAAVGARVQRRSLMTFAGEPYRNQIVGSAGASANVEVEVVTVDSVCEASGRPPDWLRIDVQGLEFEVLAGARDVLHETRGRLKIVVEMHPDQWLEQGMDPADAVDRFAALGLRAEPLEPGSSTFAQGAHALLVPLHT